MIIIIGGASGTSGTDLATLSVKDSATDEDVAVAGIVGADGDYLQAQLVVKSPLTFTEPEEITTAPSQSAVYDTPRASTGLLKLNFSTAGANAVLRIIRIDTEGIFCLSEAFTVTASSHQEGALYMAPVLELDLFGSSQIQVLLESISAGTVELSGAAV